MLFKTTTIKEAIKNNEITCSQVIFPSTKVQYNGGDSNFHLTDIFGNHHKFFRPYEYETQAFSVHVLPGGFCFSNHEIAFSKSKKILIEQTSYRTHPLLPQIIPLNTQGGGYKLRLYLEKFIALAKQVKARIKLLQSKKIQGNIALITRPDIQECYGHAISDLAISLYQVLLFAKRSKIEIDYFIFPQKLSFQVELAKIFGIENKIIPSEQNLCLQAKNLILPTLFTDYEIVEYQKRLKYRPNAYPSFLDAIYHHCHGKMKPFKKIFLKRPENSNRNFSNAKEVEEIFKEFGFEIILPDSMSLKDQIELFSQTLCLASLHGSGLMNAIFMKSSTFLFEIFPQNYQDHSPMNIALAKNMHYSYIVGDSTEDARNLDPWFENTYLNPERLKKALKILDSHIYNYGTKANMLKSH